MILNCRWFCPSRDIWQCVEIFSNVFTSGGGEGATDAWWIEASGAAEHPQHIGRSSTTKSYGGGSGGESWPAMQGWQEESRLFMNSIWVNKRKTGILCRERSMLQGLELEMSIDVGKIGQK